MLNRNKGVNLEKGQVMWEILIGLMVIALLIGGLLKASMGSVKNTSFSREESEANNWAKEKMSETTKYLEENVHCWSGRENCLYYLGYDSYSEDPDKKMCLKVTIEDKKGELPTVVPNYEKAELALVTVEVYWGIASGTGYKSCGYEENKYAHSMKFNTYVSKRN